MAANNNLEDITNYFIESGFTVTVPLPYLPVYKAIILLFAELGEDMLNDCKSGCKGRNKNIIDCYVMFESAIAAFNAGKQTLANTIIEYIKAQLNLIAKFNASKFSFTLPVDSNGCVDLFIESENNTNMCYINKEIIQYLSDIFLSKEDAEKLVHVSPVDIPGEVSFDRKSYVFDSSYKVKKNSTIVYINGVRYWNEELDGDDYRERYDVEDTYVTGITLLEGEFDPDDEVNIKGLLINQY